MTRGVSCWSWHSTTKSNVTSQGQVASSQEGHLRQLVHLPVLVIYSCVRSEIDVCTYIKPQTPPAWSQTPKWSWQWKSQLKCLSLGDWIEAAVMHQTQSPYTSSKGYCSLPSLHSLSSSPPFLSILAKTSASAFWRMEM